LQDKVYEGSIEVVRVGTEENFVDVLTKAVDGNRVSWHIGAVNAWTSTDRHGLTPNLDYRNLEEDGLEEDED